MTDDALFIRDIRVSPALILAPMEGVTDVSFRRFIRSVGGCGLTVTEFIPGKNLKEGHRRALRCAEFDPDERPISIQVYGRDPEIMADAARYVADLGADIVDFNMGCPSKKVCQNSGGSALMKEPALATAIVRAIRAAVTVPFTVKMRAGWDPDHRNAPELARMCEGEGVDMVTVHWRTRTDGYGGVRELETIAKVRQSVRIPVIANGDIVDATSARETLAQTGASGLMIGRGAIADPWVFRKILADRAGDPPLVVDDREQERVLLGYFETVRRHSAQQGHPARETFALGRMKKIARYFTADLDEPDSLRTTILHSDTVDEALDRTRGWFAARRGTPPAAPMG